MKHRIRLTLPTWTLVFTALLLPHVFSMPVFSQRTQSPALTVLPRTYGPYSGHILSGGRGLTKTLPVKDPVLGPTATWTLSAWVEFSQPAAQSVFIAGVGDPTDADFRFFALVDGKPSVRLGPNDVLSAPVPLDLTDWHLLAASFDGDTARLYVDGSEVAHAPVHAGPISPQLMLAPVEKDSAHFGGHIALFTLDRETLSAQEISALAAHKPEFSLIAFEEGSKPWALQVVQFAGNTAPQEPSMLPRQNAPFSKPKTEPLPPAATSLEPFAEGDWVLAGGWKLAETPKVTATAEQISTSGFNTRDWLAATVPGTALSTMIARGIYPDPDYGLDNLAIPESLNRQNYWYRAEFASPAMKGRSHVSLVLDGINYHAEVWLNGQHLGVMTGAFVRGVFDVTPILRTDGKNALAIFLSPAPHPGIPNVQSIAFGAGLNGGAMAIDGPTFMATEGWDWVPPMRDRDTGLWQNAHLVATGPVAIEDPQVITRLPLPDITQANITVNVPLRNFSSQPVRGTLTASFEDVTIHKEVTVAPGESTVSLAPAEFPQLHLDHPRLWWPNGYGKPEL